MLPTRSRAPGFALARGGRPRLRGAGRRRRAVAPIRDGDAGVSQRAHPLRRRMAGTTPTTSVEVDGPYVRDPGPDDRARSMWGPEGLSERGRERSAGDAQHLATPPCGVRPTRSRARWSRRACRWPSPRIRSHSSGVCTASAGGAWPTTRSRSWSRSWPASHHGQRFKKVAAAGLTEVERVAEHGNRAMEQPRRAHQRRKPRPGRRPRPPLPGSGAHRRHLQPRQRSPFLRRTTGARSAGGPVSLDRRRWARRRGAAARFVDTVAERYGGIDVLVNNAGVGRFGLFPLMRLSEIDETSPSTCAPTSCWLGCARRR